MINDKPPRLNTIHNNPLQQNNVSNNNKIKRNNNRNNNEQKKDIKIK